MAVDQLVLEYATPRAGGFVPVDGKSIGLGVVNPRIPQIETAGSIVSRVRAVLEHVPADQVFLNPDCGFATFTSRAMNSAEVATRKLAAMAEAAAELRAEGIGQRAGSLCPMPFALCPLPFALCVTSPVIPPT
jgi:5-methyltetrahydropteroyltriglutamate--homocysteine methyltransferase